MSAYYLEWRENGKRRRLSVGKDTANANTKRLRKEAELNAVNHGVSVIPTDGPTDSVVVLWINVVVVFSF